MLYERARRLLQQLPAADQAQCLADLTAWAGGPATARPANRALTLAELSQLAATELVEIGAHTLSHPLLAAMPADVQAREITDSKRQLEDWLGRPVTSFAYPYGLPGTSYTSATAALVRAAGYAGACAVWVDVVRRPTDRFQLPRLNVPAHWSGDDLERAFRTWLI